MSLQVKQNDIRQSRAVLITLGLAVFVLSALILTAPDSTIARLVVDDAYYYFKPAANWVSGSGITFDGINPTNGFHPLYFLISALIYRVTGEPTFLQLRVFLVLNLVLYAAAALLGYQMLRGLFGMALAGLFLVAWVSNVYLFHLALQSTEFALNIALLMCMFYFYLGMDMRLSKHWFRLGLVLTLLLLARLDNIFWLPLLVLCAAVSALLCAGPKIRTAIRRVGALLVVPVSILGFYIMLNLMIWGSAMPISGRVKLFWARTTLEQNSVEPLRYMAYQAKTILIGIWDAMINGWYGPNLLYQILILIGLVSIGVWVVRQPVRRDKLIRWFQPISLIACLILFMSIQLGYYAVFEFVLTMPWYWSAFYLVMVFLLASGILGILRFLQRWLHSSITAIVPKPLYIAMVGIVFVLASASYLLDWRAREDPWTDGLYETAVWMRTHLDHTALAAANASGILGYHSGLQVVNLDGLINSPEYLDSVMQDRQIEFLRKIKPRYYVQHVSSNVSDTLVNAVPSRAIHSFSKESGGYHIQFTVYELFW